MKIKGKQKNKVKSRKELRKDKRLQKKKNRFNYHNVKKNQKTNDGNISQKSKAISKDIISNSEDEEIPSSDEEVSQPVIKESDKLQNFLIREKKEHDEYFKEIQKNRVDQLKKANEDEDKVIAKYEKLLKLTRRKKTGKESSSVGKFNDGLDYLLELCTDDNIEKMYQAAKEAYEDTPKSRSKKRNSVVLSDSDGEEDVQDVKSKSEKLKKVEEKYFGNDDDFFNEQSEDDSCEGSDSELESDESAYGNQDSLNECDNNDLSRSESNDTTDESNDETSAREDIYGRKRDKEGNLIQESSKYVPPHLRKSLTSIDAAENNPERKEKLMALKRQVKGHVNKLTESNLHRIAIDIENIYGTNARNDTNTVLCEVLMNSLVSNDLSKERLVLEHTLLVAVLHANVGSEVGAFILQVLVERFDKLYRDIDGLDVENKELDNIIFFISHLFSFKIFKHDLIYEMLKKLSSKLSEKRIECILLVLKSIGFILRKEDPLLLKEFIVNVQKLTQNLPEEDKSSRAAYMMDTLMAIKNNNMSKIPQYDAETVDHFRKLLKQFIRPGNYVTSLAVTMEDLLNVEERGKWWLVGSAWAGNDESIGKKKEVKIANDDQRTKIFSLAKKQRMNTDAKKNVFYLIMIAEDYVDAFEKIISSTNDERTIVAVILQCCLSEKTFNAFYSVLAQKFCDHNRKFILAFQYAVWDRIKDIENLSSNQISNLSHFLIFLIEKGNLPLSVLKIIEFNQIEKTTLRFVQQVLVGLLLSEEEKFHKIFERISPSMKLNAFKDQLRLFLKVFLLKNGDRKLDENQAKLLKTRSQLAEKYLSTKAI